MAALTKQANDAYNDRITAAKTCARRSAPRPVRRHPQQVLVGARRRGPVRVGREDRRDRQRPRPVPGRPGPGHLLDPRRGRRHRRPGRGRQPDRPGRHRHGDRRRRDAGPLGRRPDGRRHARAAPSSAAKRSRRLGGKASKARREPRSGKEAEARMRRRTRRPRHERRRRRQVRHRAVTPSTSCPAGCSPEKPTSRCPACFRWCCAAHMPPATTPAGCSAPAGPRPSTNGCRSTLPGSTSPATTRQRPALPDTRSGRVKSCPTAAPAGRWSGTGETDEIRITRPLDRPHRHFAVVHYRDEFGADP